MKSLIGNLNKINSEQSNEMAAIADSLFQAKVNNLRVKAFDTIRDSVAAYSDSHYPLLALCDIAIKYRDKEELHNAIIALSKYQVSQRTVNKYQAFLLVLEDKLDEAKGLINKDISRFPANSKSRILSRLDDYHRGDSEATI